MRKHRGKSVFKEMMKFARRFIQSIFKIKKSGRLPRSAQRAGATTSARRGQNWRDNQAPRKHRNRTRRHPSSSFLLARNDVQNNGQQEIRREDQTTRSFSQVSEMDDSEY